MRALKTLPLLALAILAPCNVASPGSAKGGSCDDFFDALSSVPHATISRATRTHKSL